MLQSVVIITAKQTVRWSHNRLLADAATAPNHGFCCRCGKGRRRKDAVQGLWRGFTSNADAATAANCGVCCRCGKEDG